jgi:hypothetical protein
MLDVIEKTARHLGEMRFVPNTQRVGNDHPPLRAVFCQTDARKGACSAATRCSRATAISAVGTT